MSKNLIKIQCGNGGEFYLLTSWCDKREELSLTLFDISKAAYTGKITEEDIPNLSRKAKIAVSEYKQQTLKAMAGESRACFDYEVKSVGSNTVQLVWKKVIENDDIKIQLGCVSLEKEINSNNVVSRMFDEAIDLIGQQKTKMADLTLERDRLAKDKTAALEKLDKYVSIKEETEKDLFSKFVVVLNDKKAKLRHLKGQLTSPRSSVDEPSHKCTKTSSASSSSHQKVFSGQNNIDRGDSSEYETDDERPVEKSNKNRMLQNPDEDDMKDDLVLDDQMDGDDDVPIATKRQRKEKQKYVPSKPVVLKIQSTPETTQQRSGKPGSTCNSSLQKSASRSSNSGSHIIEELIDAMD